MNHDLFQQQASFITLNRVVNQAPSSGSPPLIARHRQLVANELSGEQNNTKFNDAFVSEESLASEIMDLIDILDGKNDLQTSASMNEAT
ncbi:hypothetical protein [Paraburkholderia hayleyella]|uniref:hypothetical protein n=1 Tax=Paraburkholderia hayleyella TaxID=2152889 RepID=UPI0012922492|nr:hypothetical protein [Paraburkholderia hayleyella]